MVDFKMENKIGSVIPKKIHYVWMGTAPKNELTLRCIESWKKYMPDYEIIEWNESNFDVNKIEYTAKAYKDKKWAFVSDAVRTYALKTYGGVYFDTDVELFSEPKDIFDDAEAVLGFDNAFLLSTGVMATVPEHPIFKQLWSLYENTQFSNIQDEETINTKLTFIALDVLKQKRLFNGAYFIDNVKIYPREYFSNNNKDKGEPIFAIHYFSGSWKMKTELTLVQYVIFALKFRMLLIFEPLLSSKKYIKINDSIWRWALKKTRKNLSRKARIYKVL